MTTIDRRAVANRPRSKDTVYETPDGDIPDLDRYVDRYVDGRFVNDGMAPITATVEDGEVVELSIPAFCASARADRDADREEGNCLIIQP